MKKAIGIKKLMKDFGYTQKDAEGEIEWYINEYKRNQRHIEIQAIKEKVAREEVLGIVEEEEVQK